MSKKANNVQVNPQVTPEVTAEKFVTDSYLRFGKYINESRHLPYIMDGLKPSYRRLIYTAYNEGQKMTKTATVLGKVMIIHPHNTEPLIGACATLVHAGIFEGQGSWGGTLITGMSFAPAAIRYTELKVSPTYYQIIGKLLKQVPWWESPTGVPEPRYIPTPLPLIMSFGGLGLGIGVNTRLPSFNPVSMYEAYKKNDPNLLKPNCNLTIDYSESDLKGLWTKGKGKITYKYKVTRAVSSDGASGVLIEGDTDIFTPNLSWFYSQQEQERLFVRDETDETGPKLFIGRNSNIRAITIDDIEEHALSACKYSKVYLLNVTDGSSAYRIPLKEWIKLTYENYLKLVDANNLKLIAETEYEIKVNDAIPSVADYIINKNPKADNKEISEKLSLDPEIVSSILQKPISYIRKTKEASDRSKALSSKLKELKSFDKVKFTDEVIMKL